MFHPNLVVSRFRDAHNRYLELADYDRHIDNSSRLPPQIVEQYRIGLIRACTLPVFSLLIDWACELLSESDAEGALDRIYKATEAIDNSKFDDAADLLEDAIHTIALEIEYDDLSLIEVSSIAWLMSELADLYERLTIRRDADYCERAFISIGRNQWARLSRNEGELTDLVPILAEVCSENSNVLGLPKDTTTDGVFKLIDGNPNPSYLVGIAIAYWAATHGHLVTLNDAVLSTMASSGVSPHSTVDKTAGKTQGVCAC